MSSLWDSIQVQTFRQKHRRTARTGAAAGHVTVRPQQKQDTQQQVDTGKDTRIVEDKIYGESAAELTEQDNDLWQEALEKTIGQDNVLSTEQQVEQELFSSADDTDELTEQEEITRQDDPLLTQIEEFREKALQLRQLLQDKEEKAQELQQLVSEREDKAEELQQILDERQERADGLTQAVERKLDSLVEGVNTKLDQVDELQQILEAFQKRADGFNQIVEQKLDSLSEGVNARLNQVEDSIGRERTESRQNEEQRLGMLQKSIEQMPEKFGTINQISDRLDIVKADLSEKIHTENVQSYRNMSELVKNVDERLNMVNGLEGQVKKTKGLSIGVLVLSLINLAGLVVAIVAAFEMFYIGINF